MTTVVPTAALMRRLLPAILLEGLALVGCVVAFVLTEQYHWIGAALVVALAFAAWTIFNLIRHRDEWRAPGARR
jgi:hypothetical protein